MDAIYNTETGRIDRWLDANYSTLAVNVHDGEAAFLDCPAEATHIINGEPVAAPPPLSEVKATKLAELKRTRDAAELQGFTYLGRGFDSDEKSMRRIMVAVQAAQSAGAGFSVDWTCQDDSTLTMTGAEVEGMPVAMAMAGDAIHRKWREKREAVNRATSAELVNAIIWGD